MKFEIMSAFVFDSRQIYSIFDRNTMIAAKLEYIQQQFVQISLHQTLF